MKDEKSRTQAQREADERARLEKDKDQPAVIGSGAVKQVAESGLPPGIRPGEAKDPGNAHEKGRVDNRS